MDVLETLVVELENSADAELDDDDNTATEVLIESEMELEDCIGTTLSDGTISTGVLTTLELELEDSADVELVWNETAALVELNCDGAALVGEKASTTDELMSELELEDCTSVTLV